jgi:hypothetical protein
VKLVDLATLVAPDAVEVIDYDISSATPVLACPHSTKRNGADPSTCTRCLEASGIALPITRVPVGVSGLAAPINYAALRSLRTLGGRQ